MLTFEEFWKLTEEERCEQYQYLSDRDKYRVRLCMPPGHENQPRCNNCKHYFGFDKCAAFPDKIPRERILLTENSDDQSECANGYYFEK